MQLSYNRTSPFAAGVMEPDAGGLTPLGRDAVAEMNRLGIAIDLSHANAATTSDVLALSAKPPIMTQHAGAAAVNMRSIRAPRATRKAARARRQRWRRGDFRSAVPDRLAAPADAGRLHAASGARAGRVR